MTCARAGLTAATLDAPPRRIAADGLPEPGALELRTRLIVEASAASDVVLRTALASVLAGAMLPWAISSDARRERHRLDFYAELGRRSDPDVAFPRPAAGIAVDTQPARRRSFHPTEGSIRYLHFESPFVALNPEVREDYAGLGRNRIAWAQHWSHHDGPRPTLCVIHGFGASPHRLNSVFFSLPWFFRLGYDILLYVMPLHGRRRMPLMPINGLEMFVRGFSRLTEAILHGVHDFRVFIDHLETQGVEQVGLTGLSLGGYMSALLSTVESRLHVVIPNAPVTTIAPLLRQWHPASCLLLLAGRIQGVAFEQIEAALAIHSPLSYPPRVPKDRLMIIGGLGDRLAPPEQSRLLWEHWDHPRLHWYPGNHTVHIERSAYLQEMRAFMTGSGFVPH